MKSYTLLCFFLSLALIICPLCSVQKATEAISRELSPKSVQAEENKEEDTVKIMSADSKNITETSLRDYLIGAVAAEISPTYHEEAIKAQAIACHTLLQYTKLYKSDGLNGADISDSSSSHQGYLSLEQQKDKWGDNYSKYREKLEKCVDEVQSIMIYYNSKPICAAFHAISNGTTENASEVWGGDYPYLVSVPSPGDRLSPAYSSALTVTAEEFKSVIEKNGGKASDTPDKWLGESVLTETGMVKSIKICSKEYKGTDIRNMFSLKSSTFKCEYKDNSFTFTVSGYGHGVGMSQYGADYMARQGKTYREILGHYYKGVEIK